MRPDTPRVVAVCTDSTSLFSVKIKNKKLQKLYHPARLGLDSLETQLNGFFSYLFVSEEEDRSEERFVIRISAVKGFEPMTPAGPVPVCPDSGWKCCVASCQLPLDQMASDNRFRVLACWA